MFKFYIFPNLVQITCEHSYLYRGTNTNTLRKCYLPFSQSPQQENNHITINHGLQNFQAHHPYFSIQQYNV